MSGASVLYLCFAVLLTIFLGGLAFFAFLAVILDICFIGCYIAIAWFNRGGAGSCSGNVNTVLGSGPSNSNSPGYGANGFGFGGNQNVTYAPNLHRACRLETAVFAVAIINIFLFIITAHSPSPPPPPPQEREALRPIALEQLHFRCWPEHHSGGATRRYSTPGMLSWPPREQAWAQIDQAMTPATPVLP